MVPIETLMRYIRIFSELSNQLRYAVQKRVLVEIALIKLCRPEMETDLGSVLDRIRVLEEKLENNPVRQVIVREAASEPEMPPKEEMPKPSRAASEDLQRIAANWRRIVGETTGLFKNQLLRAVPKFNTETEEPVLYVEFQGFLAKSFLDNPDYKEELQELITKHTGKVVPIEFLMGDSGQNSTLSDITVEQAMRENIHMDIVVEEEPEK